jgi:hypothetical protein
VRTVDTFESGTRPLDRGFFCVYRTAGSVAMYCRPHGYPTAPLISYKIPGIGALWEVVVPLSELSTLVAQGLIFGHYVFSSVLTNATHFERCEHGC